MKPLEQLFLSLSRILGSRVTTENFRTHLKDIASSRGISSKDKTEILIEIIAYIVDSNKNETSV